MRRLRTLAASVAIASAPFACTIVNGLEVPKRNDAGVDAGRKVDAAPCLVPDAASPSDAGRLGDGGPPLDGVYAMRRLTFSTGTFDTTNPVFCPRVARACLQPPPPSSPPATHECANSGGKSLSLASNLALEARLNERANSGKGGTLFRIQRATGTDRVLVSFYPSTGHEVCGQDVAPKWDGNDLWDLDGAALIDARSRLSTYTVETTAPLGAPFVTVKLAALTLRASSEVTLRLEAPTLTFRFGANNEPVEVLATSRATVDETFRVARSVLIGADQHPLCKDPLEEQARQFLCGSRDIALLPGAPGGRPCDAITMALNMELSPARLGEPMPAKAQVDPCADRPPPSPVCP